MPGDKSALNVRRGAVIALSSAVTLLIVIAAIDNQWTASWRVRQVGNSWTGSPISHLALLAWRISPSTDEPVRAFAAETVGTVLSIVLTGLFLWLACRGVGTARGRWSLFFAVHGAIAFAVGAAVLVELLVAGTGTGVSFTQGTTYYGAFEAGFQFALYTGWLITLVAVLAYNVTGGLDDLSPTAEYTSSPGYDYGSAAPGYSYGTATSPLPPIPPPSSKNDQYGNRGY